MRLIVGLGNPGAKYAKNRHNVGFMAVDRIIDHHHFTASQNKFKSKTYAGKLRGEKTLIVKPQTFMNLSGEAVGEVVRFYKLDIKDTIVIHDELDLAAGKIRIKTGGGHAGHNGLKSIDAHCGPHYQRIRIGIGHPNHKSYVNAHVLGDFSGSDHQWLEPLLVTIAEHIELLIQNNPTEIKRFISLTEQ